MTINIKQILHFIDRELKNIEESVQNNFYNHSDPVAYLNGYMSALFVIKKEIENHEDSSDQ